MTRVRSAGIAAALAASSCATAAHACTLCHSRLAADVRDAVFGPDLWQNAATVLAPIPVLFAAVVAVRRLVP